MKENINKLICFTSFRKMLLVLCLSLFVISCKKELFLPDQRKVQTTSKIQTIKYAEFIDAVNTSGLSGLNELLAPANHEQGGKKMTKANVAEPQFKIDMNAVKKLVLGDTISYVVSLMPSSPHAVHFQNLTVQKIKNTSIAFLTTYTPNKEWIENWKSGRKLAFSGTLTFSDIDTKKIDLTASRSAKIEPASNQVFMDAGSGKEKSKGIDNSISLAPGDCEFYDIYEFVPYTCFSGDWPGYCIWETDISSMGQLEHLHGNRVEKTTVLNCAPPDRPGSSSDGEGGGGGGGATTPTPPSDYDPCFGGSETIWYDNVYGGLKLAIAAVNPCDGGETGQNPIPTNPATEAIQSLIAFLPITDYSQQQYLKNNTNLAVAINNYLNTNGWTPDNKEFASWGIGYLIDNPYFNYHLFFDENEFSGINNPPTNITEESLINNGIKIGEVPDNASQNQNRLIGSAPKRHGNNPEDLQFGTNGNTSGILSSMINKPNAELFASMRSLLWQTSVLSPEMRTLTSQMADKFESNTGGTFENAILTKHVKKSVN